jgi:myo-inositol-1(or 4)-monophosphatase
MATTDDIQSLITFTEETARRAGALLREAYDQPVSITNKGKIDLVTQSDRDSEALILAAIKERYPHHGILAEESGEFRGEITAAAPDGSSFVWMVDPLDGTTNFAHKFPIFSVSMALRDGDDLLIGVVYDPLRDECFTAARGMGARLNGVPFTVSSVNALDQALLATGFPYDSHTAEDNNLTAFGVFMRRAQAIRRAGSAALDLAYVACGRFDGYWEMRLYPWDIAAGMLLIREAGGMVTDYAGRTGTMEMITGRRIVASNGRIHHAIIDTLGEAYT